MSDYEELNIVEGQSDKELEEVIEAKKINSDAKDSELGELHNKFLADRLVIQPNYQRKYVWDAKKASLLIESILMKIPIPMIYLAATKNNKINVIDGQQRLTSIFSFIDGKFPDDTVFKLNGLKVLTEFKGKTFKDLDEDYQNKILDYTVRTVTFASDSDPELQYEIFSRLNTGSVALNEQELRNCVYRGEFNEFIKELAADKEFLSITGFNEPHKRMADVQLVLRFISFYLYGYQNYVSPIKKFLNETMRKNENFSDVDKKQIREAFKRAVLNIKTLLGNNCFRRFKCGTEGAKNGEWEPKQLNISLYDVLMDSMARLDSTVLMRHLDSVREAYIDLMATNTEFINSIMINTSDTPVVNKRFMIWNNTLASIIKDDKADTRCFTREFKQRLFEANPTCAICGNQVNSIDDCAVDHVEQYWMGGRTIEENARLAHRFCNWSRPRKED